MLALWHKARFRTKMLTSGPKVQFSTWCSLLGPSTVPKTYLDFPWPLFGLHCNLFRCPSKASVSKSFIFQGETLAFFLVLASVFGVSESSLKFFGVLQSSLEFLKIPGVLLNFSEEILGALGHECLEPC